MEGTPAIYKGRVVSKDDFRVFIYNADGRRKLVNSWDAYETHMQTGLWFVKGYETVKKSSQDVVIEKSKKTSAKDDIKK